ncbi:hypothetical protein [Paenibacillus ginsengarvi]|uniref:DUF2269 family protein n=1 Tax=Paenibacillus ginsengarvi TaxID=400777 RepID=A0A3B0CF04_9BACL|nr:hypothetical protein [Paenibacillus ginsengarvi]RKN84233.1 hypothetical protein D7M11_14615 [Paenibacillus ginsengarvi]
MFGVYLFLHLTGLMIWLGALLAVVVMLVMMKKQLGEGASRLLANRIIRTFGLFAHPGAVVVLVSGVLMIIQMGLGSDKPLWLSLMEKGGGMIILLALVLTGILGKKARTRLNAASAGTVRLSGYIATNAGFIVLIVSLVLVVSLKL